MHFLLSLVHIFLIAGLHWSLNEGWDPKPFRRFHPFDTTHIGLYHKMLFMFCYVCISFSLMLWYMYENIVSLWYQSTSNLTWLDLTTIVHDYRGFTMLLASVNFSPTMDNHISSKVWYEIVYPFPNVNCATFEVWEWITNFSPQFIIDFRNSDKLGRIKLWGNHFGMSGYHIWYTMLGSNLKLSLQIAKW